MENNKTKKIVITIVILIAVFAVGYLLFAKGGKSPASTDNQNNTAASQSGQNNPDNSSLTVGQAPSDQSSTATSTAIALKNNMHAVTIETSLGVIKFTTYDADAPKTVQNFITLANKGFYNNLIFHRVIDGFMIQGGDPLGTGMGGPGYQFDDELNPNTDSYKAGYQKGVVAMANSGPNTNGSQFFIMVADYPLPNNYTIFGKVISGQDVADAIAKVPKDSNDKPLTPVVMKKVTVSEVK